MSTVDPVPMFTLTPDEVTKVCSLIGIVNNQEALGEHLWLRIEHDLRVWVIDTNAGRAIVRVTDEHPAVLHGNWYAVSQRVVQFASSCNGDVELALVGDSITATADDRSAVIDLIRPTTPAPRRGDRTDVAPGVIDREAFARTLWSARCTPTGADVIGAPMPPMWLQATTDTLALHVDWTDAVDGKATYRMGASFEGEPVTVAINHHAIWRFMTFFGGFDDEDDEMLRCSVIDVTPEHGTTGTTRRALLLATTDVDFITWLADPLRDRWEAAVTAALADDDITVRQHDGVEWTVRIDDVDVRIALHSGHPDVARVSTVVADHVEPGLDLLTELNALNAAATGVRFWVESAAVHAAADVRCSELASLVPSVFEVADSASRYAPLIALLGAAA